MIWEKAIVVGAFRDRRRMDGGFIGERAPHVVGEGDEEGEENQRRRGRGEGGERGHDRCSFWRSLQRSRSAWLDPWTPPYQNGLPCADKFIFN